MFLVICPGVHETRLTDCFVAALQNAMRPIQQPESECLARDQPFGVVETDIPFAGYPTYGRIRRGCDRADPLVLIAFSAGVVGAMAAAHRWQEDGGAVVALIAIDGWGVARWGDFPLYRVSHDGFTHWTSTLLGAGTEAFYADPVVSHLALWQKPEQAMGWHLSTTGAVRSSAIGTIFNWLQQVGCGNHLHPRIRL